MEERIIDDEYGRGVRLRKTKDGYVDVTDELAPENELQNGETEDGAEEEIAFEFPEFATDEDDEELATLTPEEAQELLRRREEEAKERQQNYENSCAVCDRLLRAFNRQYPHTPVEIKFSVQPLEPLEPTPR